MRKRNNRVVFYLNDDELAALNRKVQKSALSRETYLRQLINGLVPRDAPPPDYYAMMREIYHIGNNINQIAQKAHAMNVIDTKRYDEGVAEFKMAVRKITEAVILPQKLEQTECEQSSKGSRKEL